MEKKYFLELREQVNTVEDSINDFISQVKGNVEYSEELNTYDYLLIRNVIAKGENAIKNTRKMINLLKKYEKKGKNEVKQKYEE